MRSSLTAFLLALCTIAQAAPIQPVADNQVIERLPETFGQLLSRIRTIGGRVIAWLRQVAVRRNVLVERHLHVGLGILGGD